MPKTTRYYDVCASAVLALVILAGCQNTLVFTERTKAAISVEFNPTDSSEPAQLTAGYKRSIVGVVPPRQPQSDKKTHEGEALALFSNFSLKYKNDEQSNILTVRNGFASGTAAIALAGNPKSVNKFLGSTLLSPVSAELAERQRQATTFVDTLDPPLLETVAASLGVPGGPSALKNIRRQILWAQSDTEFTVVCARMRGTQIPGSEALVCQ